MTLIQNAGRYPLILNDLSIPQDEWGEFTAKEYASLVEGKFLVSLLKDGLIVVKEGKAEEPEPVVEAKEEPKVEPKKKVEHHSRSYSVGKEQGA